ncbi:hypothetical protein V1260_00365 [Brachybacterium sp. J144]|uniref:hypothetical protein n=1 Tax=unclassified Brachybacterium TaxID=2623841 RepID=UPI002E77D680|nr:MULTISPECIES: hypothetical protein [unclassified Brachybacterium]MEE1618791.1 hypothetical protein [Brachybacterium sp. J153]MEE1649240.1 hypothetical protein [Brachybacterium sp. J144]
MGTPEAADGADGAADFADPDDVADAADAPDPAASGFTEEEVEDVPALRRVGAGAAERRVVEEADGAAVRRGTGRAV